MGTTIKALKQSPELAKRNTAIADKAEHLRSQIDWSRPELADIRTGDDPMAGLLAALSGALPPRFRVEYQRKASVLAFLREHYAAWRDYDRRRADRLAGLSITEAQRSRALTDIAVLGQAWWATGDPHYGSAFQQFYMAVPTGKMFNWGPFIGSQGAVELDAYFLLWDCSGFTADGRIAFLDHLYTITESAWETQTSRWQQITLGPEGHNWYLHGMHVLPLLGLLFPQFTRSAFFLRSGWSMVEEHVRGHLMADGGARETCLGYQAGSMLCLWDMYVVAHRNGHPMSSGFADRLLAATHFLLRLMSPQAGLPSFGDGGHTPGSLTRLAAVAAALTGDRECKWYTEYARQFLPDHTGETPGQLPSCAFWDVGLEGAAAYAQTRPQRPPQGSVLMVQTGYAALRTGVEGDAAYLAVAAANRGPIVTSHGHNDVFALDVQAHGVRFLGEMGCARYGDSLGRQYDQKTEAHCTLGIVGMEQAPRVAEWRWSGHALPAVRRWISEPTHDFFHGVHEGFYRWPDHLTLHARKIFFQKTAPIYWVIFDWLESGSENDYRAYFHGCVPGEMDGNRVLLGETAGARLAVIPPAGEALSLWHEQNEGLAAYLAERKLDASRCPCFIYSKHAASDCLVWVLAPLTPGMQPPRVRRLPVTLNGQTTNAHDVCGVEIAFPDCTDMLCVSHKDFDAELTCGPLRTWGWLAFQRLKPDGAAMNTFTHTMSDGICGR